MATITVNTLLDENDGGLGQGAGDSLREAIAFATAGDTITFDAGIAGGVLTLSNGELLVDKELIIDGDETSPISIDAAGASRVFNVDDGSTSTQVPVTIDGLTITGGLAFGSANGNLGDGGGIFTNEALTLSNSTVTGNTASDNAGGIYVNDIGSANILNSTISNNAANYDGGGVFAFGQTEITNSTINNNIAIAGIGDGGGVAVFGTTDITNSTISGNTSGGDGGGVYVKDFDPGLLHYSNATISNTTITNNEAPDGQGSGLASFGSHITTTVTSTIISGNVNSDVDELTAHSNSIQSGGNNLIGTGTATANFHATGDQTGVTDPGLAPLADNGGPTQTHALQVGSVAIDAGSNPLGLTTDQRGSVFQRVVDGLADIGAFESGNSIPTPTPSPTPGPTPTPNTIFGTGNGDFIEGDGQDNRIDGLGGADEILGRQGNDELLGGTGDDTLRGNQGDDTLFGEADNDLLVGGGGQDSLLGGDGVDTLNGGGNNDILDGGLGGDQLTGGAGADSFVLRSGDGNDSIEDFQPGTDNLLLDGLDFSDLTVIQDGTDTVIRETATSEDLATLVGINAASLDSSNFMIPDGIFGTGNDDFINGDSDDNLIQGLDGADELVGLEGNDELLGGSGDDILRGNQGSDTLMGEGGNDLLEGGGGQDSLLGGDGVDDLQGGGNNDILDGGLGDDLLNGGGGADSFLLRSGDGSDLILDYVDGTDNFLLDGLTFSDLSLVSSGGNTVIQETATSEDLATLLGINATVIGSSDFVTI
ncbi:MAG: calcium-binding protein [Microcoleaceae cyanobacterium]